MRHFWQWLCGYVCIVLQGRQINRFLNLCSKNDIRLWKITSDIEHKVRVYVRLKDFYYLKPYLRKTKTKMMIHSKKGFPFWCHRHPKLKWMLLITLVLICMFVYSRNFVWEIQIHGNERISTNDLEDFLSLQNIESGIKKEAIDCSKLEYQLRQNFQKLGWVSVYINQTKLCIEIKESIYDTRESITEEIGVQYDLVAQKDAIISSIVTREGTAIVQKGQSVKSGDVLVLGECDIFDDAGLVKETLRFRADALIYGDVKRTIILPLSEIELFTLKLTGNTSDEMLFFLASKKISPILENFEENGVIILDKNVMIDKEEKNIVFIGEIKTREQIGINKRADISAEEQMKYEFE